MSDHSMEEVAPMGASPRSRPRTRIVRESMKTAAISVAVLFFLLFFLTSWSLEIRALCVLAAAAIFFAVSMIRKAR